MDPMALQNKRRSLLVVHLYMLGLVCPRQCQGETGSVLNLLSALRGMSLQK